MLVLHHKHYTTFAPKIYTCYQNKMIHKREKKKLEPIINQNLIERKKLTWTEIEVEESLQNTRVLGRVFLSRV